jgi:hypothetical protein
MTGTKADDRHVPSRDDGIKVSYTANLTATTIANAQLASSICLLRGSLHLRLSSLALAKESLMQALLLDVKNYDAFRELVEGSMMSSSEGESSHQAERKWLNFRMGIHQQPLLSLAIIRRTVTFRQTHL